MNEEPSTGWYFAHAQYGLTLHILCIFIFSLGVAHLSLKQLFWYRVMLFFHSQALPQMMLLCPFLQPYSEFINQFNFCHAEYIKMSRPLLIVSQ